MAFFPCHGTMQECSASVLCGPSVLLVLFEDHLAEEGRRVAAEVCLAEARVDGVYDNSCAGDGQQGREVAHC